MPILNYTTTIDAHRTVSEIMALLSKAGARQASIDYEEGEPVALVFTLGVRGVPVQFRLPSRHEGVLRALEASKAERRFKTPAQARRVAWRIVKDWTEAQLAIVEAEVAQIHEVFLPYAITTDGRTVAERLTAEGMPKLLGAGVTNG